MDSPTSLAEPIFIILKKTKSWNNLHSFIGKSHQNILTPQQLNKLTHASTILLFLKLLIASLEEDLMWYGEPNDILTKNIRLV